jgi:hypothetical protein
MKRVLRQIFIVSYEKANERLTVLPSLTPEPRKSLGGLGGKKWDLDVVTRIEAFHISGSGIRARSFMSGPTG